MPPHNPHPALMLGVVHRDPQGPSRLLRLLQSFQPTHIYLEVSPYAEAFRQRHTPRLLRTLHQNTPADQHSHPAIQAIAALLQLPFELRTVREYAAEQRQPPGITLLGDDQRSASWLDTVETQLLTPQNIQTLLQQPQERPNAHNALYQRVRRLLQDEPIWPPLLGLHAHQLEDLQTRDQRLGDLLAQHIQSHHPTRWLYIGGCFHLLRIKGLTLLWERVSTAYTSTQRAFLDAPLQPC